ncbi:MAG: hypothetical protein AB7P20_11435 [Rhizobiaceae bacterium]
MSKRKETQAQAVVPEYASNDGPRKASQIGADLGAVMQSVVLVKGSQAWAEKYLSLSALLAEMSLSAVDDLADVLAIQVWGNIVLETRSGCDEIGKEDACTMARHFQTRAIEAIERITGKSRTAFTGETVVILN